MIPEVHATYVGINARCNEKPKESPEHFFIDWEYGNHESSRCRFCGLLEGVDMGIHYGEEVPHYGEEIPPYDN